MSQTCDSKCEIFVHVASIEYMIVPIQNVLAFDFLCYLATLTRIYNYRLSFHFNVSNVLKIFQGILHWISTPYY